jgi:extracellular factor (EF) 3-hydroxypalmitic acid methyl ester biosynthesis protein
MRSATPIRVSSVPPRPASAPPPRRTSSPPSSGPVSSIQPHEELSGPTGASARFRPARLDAGDLPADLACRFRCDGASVGPLTVLDLSAAGFSADAPQELALAPGVALESFELLLGDRVIWSGDAAVVHGSAERIGGRFTSGVVDLHHLRLGATLEGRIAVLREQRERLPAEWRAAVGDLRQLLEDVRFEVEEIERAETHDPLRRNEEEAHLFAGLRARWGTEFYDALASLHEMSKTFDARASVLGRSYASSMLMPLLMACPLQRRAYEKPLGYAGDYRMMELCFTQELGGEGLFGRFLHSVTQNYSLARAVVAREVVVREALRATIDAAGERPVRVLAVAAGPAIELRRLLEQMGALNRPVELILLDQDRDAHETAHRHLTRILLGQHLGMLPVTVQCLHFSVRQLIKPMTPDEQRIRDTLTDLDFVYSAGLYDYLPDLVAARLTRVLYSRMRPGGRMLLGNLMETPDSSWIMDYVWGWPLLYRTEETMLRLADGLAPAPARAGITRDATGHCLFLDVTRPTSP